MVHYEICSLPEVCLVLIALGLGLAFLLSYVVGFCHLSTIGGVEYFGQV